MTIDTHIASSLKNKAVLSVGRAGMDLYPNPDGARIASANVFSSDVGGSAGNIAVALARLGCPSYLMTGLSDDAVGDFVDQKLNEYNVNTTYCIKTSGVRRTSLAIAETTADAPSVVIYRNDAADLAITTDLANRVDFEIIGAVVLTGTALSRAPSSQAVLRLIERAKNEQCPVILDLDYRPQAWNTREEAIEAKCLYSEQVDMIVGNDEEFDLIGDGKGYDYAQMLAAKGHCIIYKMGELGCKIMNNNNVANIDIFKVNVLKPFGAGDAFLGGLIASLKSGFDLKEATRRGAANAAMVVASRGCASAMPQLDELNTFIAGYTS